MGPDAPVRYYSVRVGWGCLGLLVGSAVCGLWVLVNGLVAAAAVIAEIGSH